MTRQELRVRCVQMAYDLLSLNLGAYVSNKKREKIESLEVEEVLYISEKIFDWISRKSIKG